MILWVAATQPPKAARHPERVSGTNFQTVLNANNLTFNTRVGRLKTELFYPRNWQSTTIEPFIQALDAYNRWYNEKRIKISLGALSSVEYRRSLDHCSPTTRVRVYVRERPQVC